MLSLSNLVPFFLALCEGGTKGVVDGFPPGAGTVGREEKVGKRFNWSVFPVFTRTEEGGPPLHQEQPAHHSGLRICTGVGKNSITLIYH